MGKRECIDSKNGVQLIENALYNGNGGLVDQNWLVLSPRPRPAHLQLPLQPFTTLSAARQAFEEEVHLCGNG